jgi:RES domain-containing protein
MNPAGISYLYVSLEQKTALAEVARRPGSRAFVAFFSAKNEIPVLDLTRLPRKPSVFEEDESETREAILFFESFIDAICQPVNRDGFEHIEYLPSQVVSEFFAQVFRTEHGAQLDGVLYPSTVMPGGRNLVIFPPRDYDRQFTDLVDLTSIEELGADD